jgi:nucleotide-binding universal stress UspA family protein
MAKCFGSEIVVLHVVDIPDSWPTSAGGEAQSLSIDQLHGGATAALDRFVAQEFTGARVSYRVTKGDAARQIVACAHEQQVDLIMIPTHGYGPFRSLLLGSVTAKVLHDVHCPVWTGVHAEQMTWHSSDRWKRVLCAVEADERGESVLKWAWQFARQQSLELQLVHTVTGADGMWTAENDPSMYKFLFDAAREQLAKLQSRAGTDLEIRLMGRSVGSCGATSCCGLRCRLDCDRPRRDPNLVRAIEQCLLFHHPDGALPGDQHLPPELAAYCPHFGRSSSVQWRR